MAQDTEPTQPGWYRTREGVNDWLIYALDDGQWSAHILNGDATPCQWPDIAQAGEVELIAAYPRTSKKDDAVRELTEAIRLTVEYVGNDTLPTIPGWSWYDALMKYAPSDAQQFVERAARLREDAMPTPAHDPRARYCIRLGVVPAPELSDAVRCPACDELAAAVHLYQPSTNKESN